MLGPSQHHLARRQASQQASSSACSSSGRPCLRLPHRAFAAAPAQHVLVGPLPASRQLVAADAISSWHTRTCSRLAASGNGTSASASADSDVENVVIIGSGPAGYTAAIYCARANLKPLVFEGLSNGRGGQLMTTTEVENFPGFPEGITGPDLMERMRKQAERWGAELLTEDVESVDLRQRPFVIKGGDRTVRTHSVIVATGATARRLNLPQEETYWSKGISACAICDGASPLFKGREVAVVGGGDSAAEEAVYLTKYASKVHLLVRSAQMRASKAMQDRVMANEKVQVHFNMGVKDAYGNGVLQGLHTVNSATGEEGKLPVAGLFYGIGHQPNSKLIEGQVELDEFGYVKVEPHGVATSVQGVFAAGDLHDNEWRQAITAAGSGCMAALSAERYLTANGLAKEYHQAEEAQQPAKPAEKAAAVASDTADSFDISRDKHKGQYALRKLYHESSRPLAVLYTSPTCGPCRTLKPILNGVIDEYVGKVHFVEIDIEEDGEIAEAAGVNGTPTVQMFYKKERVANLPGVKRKSEYRAIIEQHVQTPVMARR